MALLDGDRFERRFRDGVHVADVSDLMRRMVKENLLKFDGTPLFALTILQRRLASSPEAIYQSLRRRRERLENRLREQELLQRGGQAASTIAAGVPTLDAEDVEDLEDWSTDSIPSASARSARRRRSRTTVWCRGSPRSLAWPARAARLARSRRHS